AVVLLALVLLSAGPLSACTGVESICTAGLRSGLCPLTTRSLTNVRFTPQSGQSADMWACPLCANRVLARRSKDDFAHGVVMRVTVMRNGMGAGRQKSYNCMVLRAKGST